jgi:Ca2+-binding RTX toxin-like protein
MASQTITANFISTISLSADDEVLLVKKGVIGTVEGVAINAFGAFSDRVITIEGKVRAVDAGGPPEIALFLGEEANPTGGEDNIVTVTKTGELSGQSNGIKVFAEEGIISNAGLIKGGEAISGITDDTEIFNTGRIIGADAGIALAGTDISVENSGLIKASGGNAIILDGDELALSNRGTISTASDSSAIQFSNELGDVSRIVNWGTISSPSSAFFGGNGDDYIVNHGKISGDVELQGGHNTFVNVSGGKIDGVVTGGVLSDQFFIYGQKVKVTDIGSSDADTVFTNVSFKLGANLEEIVLVGRKGVDATGNNDGNELTGNAGNNVLNGKGGSDALDGGEGDDRLIGGGGGDSFAFRDGCGRDVIAGYEADIDTIELLDVTAIPEFDALKEATRQAGKDVVIDLGNGDRITILDITRAEILGSNFALTFEDP